MTHRLGNRRTASAPDSGDLTPPGYRDLVPLRQGPTGVLFRAYSERLGCEVALKVAAAPLEAAVGRRFLRQTEAIARLAQGSNVAALLDAGLNGLGLPYTAREYFPDGSLADLVDAMGPLPLTDVLHVGVLMATSLGSAHAAGILHLGVKPANIMRRSTDFALADFAVPALAQAPTVHCAPEQLQGQAPTAATDVYSLGSTLFQLLAARPPYRQEGGVASLLLHMLNDEPPRLARADVPPAVAAVVARAMAREAGQRYADASAVAAALQAVQAESGMAVSGPAGSRGGTDALATMNGKAPTPTSAAVVLGRAPGPAGVAADPGVPFAPVPDPDRAPLIGAAAPGQAPTPAGMTTGPGAAITAGSKRPGRRRWPTAAGIGAVALAAVGAPLLFGRSADKQPPSTAQPTVVVGAPAESTAPAVAAPTALAAVDAGTNVNLRWALPPGSEIYPVLIQVTPATGPQPTPVPLPADTRAFVATGLDPTAGYCFQAGLLLRFGDASHPPAEVWSTPACVRGAVVAPKA